MNQHATDTDKLPRHQFWGAGEPDCPPELKAPNGELHTMRCKACGDGWRKSGNVCLVALGVPVVDSETFPRRPPMSGKKE